MKFAIIQRSNKPKNGLPVKKLSDEIKKLQEEGYIIHNYL